MKTILCAIDFSEASYDVVKVAVDMAKQKKANLIVLYAYRLIQPQSQEIKEFRNSIEERAKSDFKALANRLDIQDNGLVTYEFRAEIGFISDRIDAYLRKNAVEIIIVGKDLAYSINDQKERTVEHFLETKIPVLVVP